MFLLYYFCRILLDRTAYVFSVSVGFVLFPTVVRSVPYLFYLFLHLKILSLDLPGSHIIHHVSWLRSLARQLLSALPGLSSTPPSFVPLVVVVHSHGYPGLDLGGVSSLPAIETPVGGTYHDGI